MLLRNIKELNISIIIKIIFFTFFLINNFAYTQIKFNKLNNSFHEFINEIDISKDTISDKYFLSFQQFDSLRNVLHGNRSYDVNRSYNEDKIKKAYIGMINGTKNKFARILKLNNNRINFEYIDTVSYVRKQIEIVKIFVDCETPFYTNMYKIENNIFLSSNIHIEGKYSYYNSMRFVLSEYYKKQYLLYDYIIPSKTVLLNVLPYRNRKGLLGFKSLSNEQNLLEAKYDTIWSYKYGYWMVHNNEGYNLIDTNYNLIFPSNLKYMRYKERGNIYNFSEDGINYYPCFSKKGLEICFGQLEDEWGCSNAKKLNSHGLYKRIEELRRSQSEIDELTLSNVSVQSISYNHKSRHYILENKVDTILTLLEYESVLKVGPILVCEINRLSWDILTITGEKIRNINYLIQRSSGANSCRVLEVFDPTTRRFGVYSIYNDVYIQPKYKYIEYSEREEFYIVMDDNGVYYLNSKGEIPLP